MNKRQKKNVKLSLCLTTVFKVYALKACGGVDVYMHIFLTSALVDEWSASRPGRFTPGTHG
jgi:hypothetical protein